MDARGLFHGPPTAYLHDEISTDKRNPTVNANGLIYGSPEESTDFAPILDPAQDSISEMKIPVRDPNTSSTADDPILMPSPYWGSEAIWSSQANAHNPMFDELGRVWFTSRIRPPSNPAFCKAGSDIPSAKLFPLESSGRQAAMYDPKTKRFMLIDTCFSTHHLQFAQDANNTLWFSSGGGGGVVGWLNSTGPVPYRNDDIALHALRPLRLHCGQLTGAAIRSVQSANSAKARFVSSLPIALTMALLA